MDSNSSFVQKAVVFLHDWSVMKDPPINAINPTHPMVSHLNSIELSNFKVIEVMIVNPNAPDFNTSVTDFDWNQANTAQSMFKIYCFGMIGAIC